MKRIILYFLATAVSITLSAKPLNSKPSTPFTGYLFAYFEGRGDTN